MEEDIMRRAMETSMQEVMACLTFTTDVGEGEDNWLPTLDITVRVEQNNRISYIHFEKPTSTNLVIHNCSAMDENSKNQILANDLVRRMTNVDDKKENKRIEAAIDKYSVKLITSGYTISQTKKIVLNEGKISQENNGKTELIQREEVS